MASIAKTLAVLALSLGLSLRVSAAGSRGGTFDLYSDDKCQDLIEAKPAPIPLEVCMPSSPLGTLLKSFRFTEKPYCSDGTTRPELYFFQDCDCQNGVANWAPNANYGDYGNGSCQANWGGEFLMFVLTCGEYDIPRPSRITFAATFPAPTPTTTKQVGCPPLGSDTSAPSVAASTGGGDDEGGATAAAGGVTAAPTSGASSSDILSLPTMPGTKSKGVQATSASSQTAAAAKASSVAIGRYDEVGMVYWTGLTAVFGVVSFLAL
ncbi:hypothetical protein GGI43DRAFT_61386 [Trichoderma evansii]